VATFPYKEDYIKRAVRLLILLACCRSWFSDAVCFVVAHSLLLFASSVIEEVMFLSRLVGLSVCLSVSVITQQLVGIFEKSRL